MLTVERFNQIRRETREQRIIELEKLIDNELVNNAQAGYPHRLDVPKIYRDVFDETAAKYREAGWDMNVTQFKESQYLTFTVIASPLAQPKPDAQTEAKAA